MRQEEFLKLERKVEEVNDWRHRPANVYTRDGLALVSKAATTGRDLNAAVKAAVDAIGGVRRALQPHDRVLLKANFNSDDEYPASTDLGFLEAVVQLLEQHQQGRFNHGYRLWSLLILELWFREWAD